MTPNPRIQRLFEQPLCFQIAGKTQHAPMISAKCKDESYRFILDTGASDHLLCRRFANLLNISVNEEVSGVDHAGADVQSWKLERVPLTIDNFDLDLIDAVAADLPPLFAEQRIGGILSVGRLHPSAHVFLDFARDRWSLLPGDPHQICQVLKAERPGMDSLSLNRIANDSFLLINAALVPGQELTFLLNTGGRDVEIVAGDTHFPLKDEDVTGHGVSGAAVFGGVQLDQFLQISGREFPVPKLVLRESMGAPFYSGDIGMALLRNTSLLISSVKDDPIFWLFPGEWGKPLNL